MILNLTDAINRQLIENAKKNDRDYSYFHPSEWDGCKRKTAYAYYESKGYIQINEDAVVINPHLERIFSNGHFMHSRWRYWLEPSGAMLGVWECKNFQAHGENRKFYGKDKIIGCERPKLCECGCSRFRYHEIKLFNEETLWGGSVDTVIDQRILSKHLGMSCSFKEDEHLIAIDFKSINHFDFGSLTGPTSKHTTQMQIYLYLAGLKYGKFVYENKNTQSIKEFLVIQDDNLLRIKKSEAIQLKKIISTTKNGQRLLPVRGHANRADSECMSCKFRGDCWKDRTPQSPAIEDNQTNNVQTSSLY